MSKKICPFGHTYDQNIYGDTCPICAQNNMNVSKQPLNQQGTPTGPRTKVVQSSPIAGGTPYRPTNVPDQLDPIGDTKVVARKEQAQIQSQQRKTVIRRNPAVAGGVKSNEAGRKLVGFLVTYNRTPMGKAYNVYEGRNVIGRESSCDISIPDDEKMSGRHMSIRYLSGNNKFRFHDEMSSNGTYVNNELLDDGELQNYDILVVGSTVFIFIAIPQI